MRNEHAELLGLIALNQRQALDFSGTDQEDAEKAEREIAAMLAGADALDALVKIADVDLRRASAGYIQQIAARALEGTRTHADTAKPSDYPEASETP